MKHQIIMLLLLCGTFSFALNDTPQLQPSMEIPQFDTSQFATKTDYYNLMAQLAAIQNDIGKVKSNAQASDVFMPLIIAAIQTVVTFIGIYIILDKKQKENDKKNFKE